jgi:hypothetical protein
MYIITVKYKVKKKYVNHEKEYGLAIVLSINLKYTLKKIRILGNLLRVSEFVTIGNVLRVSDDGFPRSRKPKNR